MIFSYKAVDRDGKQMSGRVEADSSLAVIAKIKEKGLFPLDILEEKTERPLTQEHEKKKFDIQINASLFAGSGVAQKDIVLFTRQLATLISAGLPLAKSLSVLKNQQRGGKFKKIIGNILEQVETGNSFSEALSKNPTIFTNLFVNSIRAGETGGVLEVVLSRLADFGEKNLRLNKRIKSALVYPALVIMIAVSVLAFLITFIVPRFIDMFRDLKIPLPLPTQVLVKVSNFARHYWFVVILSLIGLFIIYKLLVRMPKIKYVFDFFKLKLPIFGALIQKLAIARFSRTFGTLLSSGVGILQAILIARDMVGNQVIANSIDLVHSSVREGQPVAKPLKKIDIFPLMTVNMIEVGEETGSLDKMLLKVADIYDEEVDTTIATLTSLLEPFLIILMGFVVGSIVISMFLPLISLLNALGAS